MSYRVQDLISLWVLCKLDMFSFEIKAHCPNTRARVGSFQTPHGFVSTPRFMPVGTLGTVKGITSSQLKDVGAQMLLANTYHLHLQPGEQVIQDAGGLHKFMGWSGPILTCLLYTSPSPRD